MDETMPDQVFLKARYRSLKRYRAFDFNPFLYS
jgi:hypothetical protein